MRRIPLLLMLAIVALLTFAAPASAHTELFTTAPEAGTVAEVDLPAVTLTFTQQVDPRLATIAVRRLDGDVVSQGRPVLTGPALVQTVGELAAGRYDVQWRAAAADGHILSGEFRFRVSDNASATPDQVRRLSPAEQLREHAKGNYDHGKPSYAVAAEDRPQADESIVAAPPAPVPAMTDNAGGALVALLAAAAGVTVAGGVLESLRRT